MNKRVFSLLIIAIGLIVCCGFTEAGCDTAQQASHNDAIERAANRRAYVPHNDMEFHNYDNRQRIADDPTTIMWCTAAFPMANAPLFTVPIVGKVTSGTKRPYESDPGPDGMYGPSSEYDYGFSPAKNIAEWRKLPQFCTNEPMVWQKEKTIIALTIDSALNQANTAARAALSKGMNRNAQGEVVGEVPEANKDAAMKILTDAIGAGGK